MLFISRVVATAVARSTCSSGVVTQVTGEWANVDAARWSTTYLGEVVPFDQSNAPDDRFQP